MTKNKLVITACPYSIGARKNKIDDIREVVAHTISCLGIIMKRYLYQFGADRKLLHLAAEDG